jgi:hypothetical protein
MKSKEYILKFRRSTFLSLWTPILLITFVIIIVFLTNYQLFENIYIYYTIFSSILIIFLLYSFFVKEIVLTSESLIFVYYFWFKWRNESIKINEIKEFVYYPSGRYIIIEIVLFSDNRLKKYTLNEFNENTISNLYYELYNHPLNKIESNLV